jgi:hypothetical protein
MEMIGAAIEGIINGTSLEFSSIQKELWDIRQTVTK